MSSEQVAQVSEATTDIPPPAYAEASSPAPPHIPPTNFLAISRRMGEVKDTFVLDPALRVPHTDDQPHLSLSTLMGEVAAEVYVVGSAAHPTGGGKTRMVVTSTIGTANLQLASRPAPRHASIPRAPISVSVNARGGEANLLLPRSFRGPLRISITIGMVELSAALRAVTTIFGDERMFVGACTQAELEGVWDGDEAVVYSKLGNVYVGYEGEAFKGKSTRTGHGKVKRSDGLVISAVRFDSESVVQ
ncbi:hypothetical protein B0H17DRAFT_1220535 [Mycena rosella]|uniref:DUF7330 domain-containing protein n=1 Tax=Mycena rosella TaxID=1033263 RepID=A0AAD7FF76_MYCRO|nr:hypothetical protein B0H17DRAFT_1220535 [Mycena rosella]